MRRNSDFLKSLADHNPQSASGTDWTLIASSGDSVTADYSGLALVSVLPGYMTPGHLVLYRDYEHTDIDGAVGVCCDDVEYWQYHGRPRNAGDTPDDDSIHPGGWDTSGPKPVDWAFDAVSRWSEF
jgi:hypothetical protein